MRHDVPDVFQRAMITVGNRELNVSNRCYCGYPLPLRSPYCTVGETERINREVIGRRSNGLQGRIATVDEDLRLPIVLPEVGVRSIERRAVPWIAVFWSVTDLGLATGHWQGRDYRGLD